MPDPDTFGVDLAQQTLYLPPYDATLLLPYLGPPSVFAYVFPMSYSYTGDYQIFTFDLSQYPPAVPNLTTYWQGVISDFWSGVAPPTFVECANGVRSN